MIRIRGRRRFPPGPGSSICPGCTATVLVEWAAAESGQQYECPRCPWIGMLIRPPLTRADRRAIAAVDRVVT